MSLSTNRVDLAQGMRLAIGKVRMLAGLAALVLAAMSAAPASAQGAYGEWSRKAQIMINTSSAGAAVTADVKAFALPVTLTAANFDFSQAQQNGEDLRFTSAAGAALPYEIENWDAAGKKAAVWVKTDVKGNDAAQSINMHCGNAAAKSESDSKKVFPLEEGLTGVWHTGEAGNTAEGGYKDATPNEAHATGYAFAPANTADCRIGKCPEFKNSAKRYLRVNGTKNALFDITNKLTFSIWVKAAAYPTEYITIFAKGDDSWRVQMYGIYSWGDNNGKYVSEMCVEAGGDACLEHRGTAAELKPNEWHLLTVVHDNPTVKYYIDMTPVTKQYPGNWTSGAANPVGIGYQSQMNARWYDGWLDEARVIKAAKDENWIKLNYESQREGSKLVEVKAATTGLHRVAGFALRPVATGTRHDVAGRQVARSARGVRVAAE